MKKPAQAINVARLGKGGCQRSLIIMPAPWEDWIVSRQLVSESEYGTATSRSMTAPSLTPELRATQIGLA